MQLQATALPGVCLIRPDVGGDADGRFTWYYNERDLAAHGLASHYVQEHASFYPRLHTVRGLHFQAPPREQVKVVRVARGRILDVVVDVRRGAPTYGQHVAVELGSDDWTQLYVPPGFAHGFCTLAPDTEVVFRLTDYNERTHLAGLRWNDPALGIPWPCGDRPGHLFDIDAGWPDLQVLESPFALTAPAGAPA